jgi:hypothetical protein
VNGEFTCAPVDVGQVQRGDLAGAQPSRSISSIAA